jgi:hypothetical protein
MIGYEGTFGTAATAGFVLPVNYGEGVKGTQSINRRNTIRGNRNPQQPFRGNREVSGPVPVPLDSGCFPYWLCALFGNPTTAGSTAATWQATHDYASGDLVVPTTPNGYYYEATTDAGSSNGSEPTWPTAVGDTVVDDGITWTCRAYVHEWKVGNTQPQFTYEKSFTDLTTDRYARHLGCKVDTLSLDIGGDGELVANLGIYGAEDSWQTSPFDASPTTPSFSAVNNFGGAITEGGSSSDVVTAVSLNLGFGIDKRSEIIPIANAGIRTDLPVGSMQIGGSVTAIFNDDGYTLLNKGIAATESSLKVTITASDISVVEFEIQELEYSRDGVEVQTPEGLLVPMNFEGYYDNGSEAAAIVWRVTNHVSGYSFVA